MTSADPFDVVHLARRLIGVNTAGGCESDAVEIVAPLLENAGMSVHRVPMSPGRDNLVATHKGGGAFILSGHLDTVPYDEGEWSSHPLDGHLSGDRLVGRGSSDMKAGVAAMVCAAVRQAGRESSGPGFTLLLSAGEETGCEGAAVLQSAGVLPANPVLVIGEATANRVRLGHKGAVWFGAHARGTAAHGSRPELGRNAIEMLLPLAAGVSKLVPDLAHPHLGRPTISLGTFTGGLQTNLVPDSASLTLDLRTVPGLDPDEVEASMELMFPDGRIERILDLPAVWTNEGDPATEVVNSIVASVTGEVQVAAGASYFTDAAVLAGNQPRAFIIGPGEDGQPHTVDEYCSVTRIRQAVELYEKLLDAWQLGRIA